MSFDLGERERVASQLIAGAIGGESAVPAEWIDAVGDASLILRGSSLSAQPEGGNAIAYPSWTPDGRWLAVTSSHEFRVFDTNDWSVVFSMFNTDAYYTTVPLAFTPDGQHLLMSENQIDLRLLQTGTWKPSSSPHSTER